MANKLPEFENENPALSVQKVNSRARGFDAFAESFNKIANTAEKAYTNIADEQSNASLIQSSNLVNQLKNESQIQMLKDPAHAVRIAENAENTAKTIKQSTPLNKTDRSRFDYMLNNQVQELKYKGQVTEFNQSKLLAKNHYFDELPKTLDQIQQFIHNNDMKAAEDLEETLHRTTKGLADSGIVSSEQLFRVQQTIKGFYEQGQRQLMLHQLQEGASAEDFHHAYSSPFSTRSFTNIGQPSDVNTQWLADHLSNERTAEAQFENLYNDRPINYAVVSAFKDGNFEKFVGQAEGAYRVRASIAANVPFNVINARVQNILDKPEESRTQTEKGAVNYWSSFKSRLGTDNGFYAIMAHTKLGAEATAQHDAEAQAIADTKQGAEQYEALRQNDNYYIGRMVDIAHSSDLSKLQGPLDSNYIKPIPAAWVQEARSSFQKGAPTDAAINRLAYLNPEFRPFLADAMPQAHQAAALYFAGVTLGKTNPEFQQDLIHANQDQVNPIGAPIDKSQVGSALNPDKENKRAALWAQVLSNDDTKTLFQYLAKLPGGQAATEGFRNATLNYIEDQALRAGDIEVRNADAYIKKFNTNIKQGFNFYRTNDALINTSDIPVSSSEDASNLKNYALSEAYRRLEKEIGRSALDTAIDLNPLMVISTPDKRLVVIDRSGRAAVTRDGHEVFDQTYTSALQTLANEHNRRTRFNIMNELKNANVESPYLSKSIFGGNQ